MTATMRGQTFGTDVAARASSSHSVARQNSPRSKSANVQAAQASAAIASIVISDGRHPGTTRPHPAVLGRMGAPNSRGRALAFSLLKYMRLRAIRSPSSVQEGFPVRPHCISFPPPPRRDRAAFATS
jgi:hypothetical protein